MTDNCGVSVYQAQVAQAREWIGDDLQGASIRELKIFEVEGNVGGGLHLEGEAKKSDAKAKTLPLPQGRGEAKNIVDSFENAAKEELQRRGCRVSDNVGQHAMGVPLPRSLFDEKWPGTEEEELDWYAHLSFHSSKLIKSNFSYVSEMLYIHSKLMIVDDRRVIVRIDLILVTIVLTLL